MKLINYSVPQITPHPELLTLHTSQQHAAHKEFIKKFGFTNPITVSEKSGYLLDGFIYAQIAMELGIEEIPAIIISLTPQEEITYIATVNSLSKAVIIDRDRLDEVYSEIPAKEKGFLKVLADLNILPLEGTKLRKRRTKILEETEFIRDNTARKKNSLWRAASYDIVLYGESAETNFRAEEFNEYTSINFRKVI